MIGFQPWLRVDIIVAAGDGSAQAAKAATATIPIVFGVASDPIQVGLVTSLNRPTGNITGITFFAAALGAKRMGFAHELVPGATSIGLLANPNNPSSEPEIRAVKEAAATFGLPLVVIPAENEVEVDAGFAAMIQRGVGALLVGTDGVLLDYRDRLADLAARHALPTIYPVREFVAAGGLMSYGTSIPDAFRQVGVYAGRILRGEKPAELPTMLPSKFELAINLTTAKALGLTIPLTLQYAADEVVE